MQLEINNLSKEYKSGVWVLKDVNLKVESGMFGLLGPNGAGKSTLLRILATLLNPTCGQAFFNGIDIIGNGPEIRKTLGFLPQHFGLYKTLTAWEFLDYVAALKGVSQKAQRQEEVEHYLQRVNLWERRHDRTGTFSGGMKQRLGIAQALIGNSQLIIIDEPTAGLDPEERIRLHNLLAELATERVIILSTHILSDVENLCNRLAVLVKGRVAFNGSPEELARHAVGLVWEITVSPQEYEGLMGHLKIMNAHRISEEMKVRFLAREQTFDSAVPVNPTPEDGYMALTGGVA